MNQEDENEIYELYLLGTPESIVLKKYKISKKTYYNIIEYGNLINEEE